MGGKSASQLTQINKHHWNNNDGVTVDIKAENDDSGLTKSFGNLMVIKNTLIISTAYDTDQNKADSIIEMAQRAEI